LLAVALITTGALRIAGVRRNVAALSVTPAPLPTTAPGSARPILTLPPLAVIMLEQEN